MSACPMCAEEISVADATCPHCGSVTGNHASTRRPTAVDAGSAPKPESGRGTRSRGAGVGLAVGVVVIIGSIVAVPMLQREPSASHRRTESIQRAHVAAERADWTAALDEIEAAAGIAPMSADEQKLRELWTFQRTLELYCAGRADDLTASDLYPLPTTIPPGLDASTVEKAHQLLARRDVIRQARELRKRQQDLSRTASEEPRFDEKCETAINAVQTARTVSLMVVRKLDTDYGPGVYEVQDATGRTARLATTDTTFTTTGWTRITAYAFDDINIIELSAAHRARALECLADHEKAVAARAEFAASSKQLDAKIGALSQEFVSSCASANTPPARLPASQPAPPSNAASPGALAGDPWSPPPGPAPAQLPAALTGPEVHALMKSQVDALRNGGQFAEAFADDAVAFFPYSLDLYDGKERVEEGYRASWPKRRTPTIVSSDDVNVGLDVDIAWATTTWTLIYLNDARERVRVTEVIARVGGNAKVVAASFSVAASGGAPVSPPAIPAISSASSEGDVVAPTLLHPLELAKSVRNDPAVHAFGSDVGEDFAGPEGVRKLLGGWKNLKLQYAGNPRIIERGTAKIIVAYARWRSSVFRVLALFSPGDEMVNVAPWEMLTVDYSVVAK